MFFHYFKFFLSPLFIASIGFGVWVGGLAMTFEGFAFAVGPHFEAWGSSEAPFLRTWRLTLGSEMRFGIESENRL